MGGRQSQPSLASTPFVTSNLADANPSASNPNTLPSSSSSSHQQPHQAWSAPAAANKYLAAPTPTSAADEVTEWKPDSSAGDADGDDEGREGGGRPAVGGAVDELSALSSKYKAEEKAAGGGMKRSLIVAIKPSPSPSPTPSALASSIATTAATAAASANTTDDEEEDVDDSAVSPVVLHAELCCTITSASSG